MCAETDLSKLREEKLGKIFPYHCLSDLRYNFFILDLWHKYRRKTGLV